jgi:hypothetical protein
VLDDLDPHDADDADARQRLDEGLGAADLHVVAAPQLGLTAAEVHQDVLEPGRRERRSRAVAQVTGDPLGAEDGTGDHHGDETGEHEADEPAEGAIRHVRRSPCGSSGCVERRDECHPSRWDDRPRHGPEQMSVVAGTMDP